MLGVKITEQYYRENPEVLKKHGEKGRAACQSDIINHLTYLVQAASIGNTEFYREYISWNKTLFKNLNIQDHVLLKALELIRSHLTDYPKMKKILSHIIDEYDEIPVNSPPTDTENENYIVAEKYLDLLLDGKREEAYELVTSLFEGGTSLSSIYIDILQQVQYLVGYLWHTNEITVAQEHYITQATRLIMSKLYHETPPTRKSKGKILATCVPGELHDMGLQMVSDLLELDGWSVDYLGPNTPQDSILDFIGRESPDIVALSVTISMHVTATQQLIQLIRQRYPDVKIITGGYSFMQNDGLWEKIRADGYARDAVDAINLVNSISDV